MRFIFIIGCFFLLLLCPAKVFAQQNIQTVIANGGAISLRGQYSVASVIGEMAVSSFSSSNYSGVIGYLNTEDELTSTRVINKLNDFIIYPNPNNGVFNLTFSNSTISHSNIKIFNAIGQSINFKSKATSDGLQINLGVECKGVYMIILNIDNSAVCKSIFIN